MKRGLSIALVILFFVYVSLPAIAAEILVPLELGMPFGIIHSTQKESEEVYESEDINPEEHEHIDILPDGYIVQILAVYIDKGSCRVYYFDDEGNSKVGYLSNKAVEQLNIVGLIGTMEDPDKAEYMQQFIGESLPYVNGTLEAVTENYGTLATAVLPGLTENTLGTRKPTYILNKNTRKIHLPSCSSINDIHSENFVPFNGTIEEAEAMGYKACKLCKP